MECLTSPDLQGCLYKSTYTAMGTKIGRYIQHTSSRKQTMVT